MTAAREIASVLAACPHLTDLNLWGLEQLRDTHERTARFERVTRLSGAGWAEVFAAVPSTVVSLQIGDDAVDDDAIEALCDAGAHLFLRHLEVKQTNKVTEATLHHLASSHLTTSLTSLNISMCFFNDDEVVGLVEACPSLRKLTWWQHDIDDDDDESDELHACWAELVPRLTSLMEQRGGVFDGGVFY